MGRPTLYLRRGSFRGAREADTSPLQRLGRYALGGPAAQRRRPGCYAEASSAPLIYPPTSLGLRPCEKWVFLRAFFSEKLFLYGEKKKSTHDHINLIRFCTQLSDSLLTPPISYRVTEFRGKSPTRYYALLQYFRVGRLDFLQGRPSRVISLRLGRGTDPGRSPTRYHALL